MITAIRRRETAEESTGLLFQTTKLLTAHFRREADKKKIYELSGKENTINQLLIASTAVHIYHYLGIHTIDTMESGNISVSNIDKIEKMEKTDLYQELADLVNDSVNYEINLMKRENSVMENLLSTIIQSDKELTSADLIDIREDLEDDLVEILQKFPYVYFFDYVGNILGYIDHKKNEIIVESSQLRAISKDIEEQLVDPGREDDYIELSTLQRVISQMKKDFEFDSKKDLKMETLPVKMITNKVVNRLYNRFPTSKRALSVWLEAIKFTKEVIAKFSEANKTKTDYELFEFDIQKTIKDKIAEISKSQSSNNLIYFLQFLSDKEFLEIIEMFNRFGVTDIPTFVNLFNIDSKRFFNILKMYGIGKMDLIKLANPVTNPIKLAEIQLLKIKNEFPEIKQYTINDLLEKPTEFSEIINLIAKKLNISPENLVKTYRKNQIIDIKIRKSLNLSSISSLVLLYEHQEILDNVVREIYYSMFSRITRQTSRILETYIKVKEDLGIFLLGLKRVNTSISGDDEWVSIKIEELMIERLKNRQQEFAMIFNAETDPYLVNGFILARLLDSKLSDCVRSLKEDPCMLYGEIKSTTLPKDLISPVSYVFAFELLQRYKESQEKRMLHVESASIKEEQKIETKKKEIRQAQEKNTLNWIDRKISTSIMRVSSKGINPTTLYWSEKDNQTCSDNLKLHSETGDSVVDQYFEFYKFALTRMKIHWEKTKIPDDDSLRIEIKSIVAKTLAKRLRKEPDAISEEIINNSIIEGERRNISEQISKKIGKKLDKILYKKFKKSLK